MSLQREWTAEGGGQGGGATVSGRSLALETLDKCLAASVALTSASLDVSVSVAGAVSVSALVSVSVSVAEL